MVQIEKAKHITGRAIEAFMKVVEWLVRVCQSGHGAPFHYAGWVNIGIFGNKLFGDNHCRLPALCMGKKVTEKFMIQKFLHPPIFAPSQKFRIIRAIVFFCVFI